MVDAVFHRIPHDTDSVRPRPGQRGAPTLEITAGGPISAFVEAAGEATKTGSGSSKPDIVNRHARYVAIDRTVPFLRHRYTNAARTCHSASVSYCQVAALRRTPLCRRGLHHAFKKRKDTDSGKRCVARCEGRSVRRPRSRFRRRRTKAVVGKHAGHWRQVPDILVHYPKERDDGCLVGRYSHIVWTCV
jgi:hypothetical protein